MNKPWVVIEIIGTQNPNAPYSTLIEVYCERFETEAMANVLASQLRREGRTIEVREQAIQPVRRSLPYQGIARRSLKDESE